MMIHLSSVVNIDIIFKVNTVFLYLEVLFVLDIQVQVYLVVWFSCAVLYYRILGIIYEYLIWYWYCTSTSIVGTVICKYEPAFCKQHSLIYTYYYIVGKILVLCTVQYYSVYSTVLSLCTFDSRQRLYTYILMYNMYTYIILNT